MAETGQYVCVCGGGAWPKKEKEKEMKNNMYDKGSHKHVFI